ncbi:MAG TPA: hypothetical protein VK821_17430 [Dehalococcoidia bacterium]|nr:hypothetical protein [Dehalococcoidia bacterium]
MGGSDIEAGLGSNATSQDRFLRARRPTARQVEAVYLVMRLLRRDRPDDASGEEFRCDGCGRDRPRSGSVAYGDLVLCNGCATDYELMRLAEGTRLPVGGSGISGFGG